MKESSLKVPRNGGRGRHSTNDVSVMRLVTKVFEVRGEKYGNMIETAEAMGISVSQVYRVRQGKRPINEKFIIGTMRAFPEYKLDDLFCIVPAGRQYGAKRYE
jgi:hypothetical protein